MSQTPHTDAAKAARIDARKEIAMTTKSKSKADTEPTTLADMLAAVELGAIDPSTPVIAVAALDKRIRAERDDAFTNGIAEGRASYPSPIAAAMSNGGPVIPEGSVILPAGVHDCAIAGCAHGVAHGANYVPQPDRQTVLMAPCGSRIRITSRAFALAGGSLTCGHGDAFVGAPRRTYSPRSK